MFYIIKFRGDYMDCNYHGLDYRNMPPHLLNNNIPEGRTMIKWQPFATMPEQYENIDKMIESQLHMPEPYHTEDLMQELELKLRDLLNENVILRYWQDGFEYQIECKIEHIDNGGRIITVSKEDSLIYVEFKYIYDVRRYDYI